MAPLAIQHPPNLLHGTESDGQNRASLYLHLDLLPRYYSQHLEGNHSSTLKKNGVISSKRPVMFILCGVNTVVIIMQCSLYNLTETRG